MLYLVYLFEGKGIKGAVGGLFCSTYPELRDRQISKIEAEFPLWLGELKESKAFGLGFHIRPQYGGAVLTLRNLDDPKKYQSAEFAVIAVDELPRVKPEVFNILRGSLRWPGVEHTVFLAAGNPGGVGHAHVKALWIDKKFPPELAPLANQFCFIRALPKDNPYLTQSYWDELNALPEPLRSAWRDGNWDVFEGMAFPTYDPNAHVIEPFTPPTHWPKWRGVDWGTAKPFCCLWRTKDPDTTRHYTYRELYAPGLTDRQQAKSIRANTPEDEDIVCTYADPSMWATKNVQNIVSSSADEYAAEGVPLTPADNKRLAGKRKVDRLLGPLPDGLPGIQFTRNCRNLIRTLPALPYSETQPEDVDTDAEDHAYDALRYGLTPERDPHVELREERQPRRPQVRRGMRSKAL